MNNFIDKYKKDHKFQTKIKLIISIIFVIIVTIYATTLDIPNKNESLEEEQEKSKEEVIKIPNNVNYNVKLKIDEEEYEYYIKNINQETTIKKMYEGKQEEYLYKSNKYYYKNLDNYILTTKENVFDNMNPNYIDLQTINEYLNTSKVKNNQYIIYLKDIVIGENSEEYFIITINNNKILIDYTPLIKLFNSSIKKFIVDIEIIK